MYALLAICITLCPTRLDENIQPYLKEKYGEHLSKMQRGLVLKPTRLLIINAYTHTNVHELIS